MERVVRERMTIQEIDKATPNALINIRPVVAAMKEFFGGSQLSQFMDQTNPLAELTSKRRLSALGPGGLSRERAGFDVRDVHHSHYGRICPIETPEGPNIGLIGSLATFGRINDYGFIETPYRKVQAERRLGRPGRRRATRPAPTSSARTARSWSRPGEPFDRRRGRRAEAPEGAGLPDPPDRHRRDRLPRRRRGGGAPRRAGQRRARRGRATSSTDRIPCRYRDQFPEVRAEPDRVHGRLPKQVVSVATALIPFLEHDDANRALMGSNMQRQAVPLLEPEAPIVGTGMERRAAQDSGQVVHRPARRRRDQRDRRPDPGRDGRRRAATSTRSRSSSARNQGTCINQRPIVDVGQRVEHRRPDRRLVARPTAASWPSAATSWSRS